MDITCQPSKMNHGSPSFIPEEPQKSSVHLSSPLPTPSPLSSDDDAVLPQSASFQQSASSLSLSGSNDLGATSEGNQRRNTESAPTKKKPPPFIRSRIASGASPTQASLASSSTHATTSASSLQSTQAPHLPRKSLRSSLMDIKLPFLQNPLITTTSTPSSTDDSAVTEMVEGREVEVAGRGGEEDGVGILDDLKPSPILSHMKRPKIISPKRRPTKTTFSATTAANSATELEQETPQSSPQTPPTLPTVPPLPPRIQQPPPMPTSLPPKLY
jgi:hypothetical protein